MASYGFKIACVLQSRTLSFSGFNVRINARIVWLWLLVAFECLWMLSGCFLDAFWILSGYFLDSHQMLQKL